MEAKLFTIKPGEAVVHWTVEGETVDSLTLAVGRLMGWLQTNEFHEHDGFGNAGRAPVAAQGASSAPAKASDVPQCKFCDGDVWDNRENKRSENGPDFKCKKKQGCGAAAWIQDDGSLFWKK